MQKLKMGIVGTGLIAGVIARASKNVNQIELSGIAGTSSDKAQSFAQEYNVKHAYENWEDLVSSEDIDIVYVATPTSVREEICIAGANNKKHIIAEKPFASFESLTRILDAVKANEVCFMDATHFVHHPRTKEIQKTQFENIGDTRVVRTSFFFPSMDRTNIRLNPEKEPTGAVGDMALVFACASIIEFLNTDAEIKTVEGGIVRDSETHAVVRGCGTVTFTDGKSSSFDFGYDVGSCLMDLDILGEKGMLRLDDFVLDWKSGFAFDNPEFKVGYWKRSGVQEPKDFQRLEVDSEVPQAVLMLDDFVCTIQAPSLEKKVYKI